MTAYIRQNAGSPSEVNVKDYGATGNGTTNDSTAIQAAIDAAGTRDEVLFPDGTYLLTTGLTVAASVTLRFIGTAKLTCAADQDINLILVTAGDVAIHGGVFDHNHAQTFANTTKSPIRVTGCNSLLVQSSGFLRSDYAAIAIAAAANITRIRILNCLIDTCYGGIFIQGNSFVLDTVHIQNVVIDTTVTEAIDINSNASSVVIDNPIIRRPYIIADLVTGESTEPIEAIDVENCKDVVINNPMIDGASVAGTGQQCPTGIKVKGGITTESVKIIGGFIRNLKRPANNTTLIDETASNWTLSGGNVTAGGSTLTWTGTADARDTITATANMTYVIKLEVTGMTTGNLVVTYDGDAFTSITENGQYTFYKSAGAVVDSVLLLDGQASFDGAVDLSNSYMFEHWGAGVVIAKSPYVSVIGTTFDTVQNGISVIQIGTEDTYNPIISNCTFLNYQQAGIGQYETDLHDFLISGNTFNSSDKISDIELLYGEKGAIINNVIATGPAIINVRRGTGPIVIKGNIDTSGHASSVIDLGASVPATVYATDNHGWDQSWDGSHFVMSDSTPWHFWVDATNDFRISAGKPASDTDGTIVGTQS